MSLPEPAAVWWERVTRRLRAKGPGADRESTSRLRAIDERARELADRGELAAMTLEADAYGPIPTYSLLHPELLPLLDELGTCLGVGACPR